MKKVDNQKVLNTLKQFEQNARNGKKFIIDFMMSKPIKLNFNDECFEVVARTETAIKYNYNSEKK
jgi:hypothetical protein